MVRHLREIWNDIDLHYSLLYRITTNVTRNVINLKIIELTVIRFLPVSHRNCFNLLKVRDLSLLNTTLSLQLSFSTKIKWYAFIHFHKTPLQLSICSVYFSSIFIMIYSRKRYLRFDRFARQWFRLFPASQKQISVLFVTYQIHLSSTEIKMSH